MALTATPTRTLRATLARVLTLIQRSNSWCTGADLKQVKDSTGKIRSSFCLRGAIRAAVGGSTGKAQASSLDETKAFRAAAAKLIETARANPQAFGLTDDKAADAETVVALNDGNTYVNVRKLVATALANS